MGKNGEKWEKKCMEREGNKLSIFKIKKSLFFPMMYQNLDLGIGKSVKSGEKDIWKEREEYSF